MSASELFDVLPALSEDERAAHSLYEKKWKRSVRCGALQRKTKRWSKSAEKGWFSAMNFQHSPVPPIPPVAFPELCRYE